MEGRVVSVGVCVSVHARVCVWLRRKGAEETFKGGE